jgi:hypothetical protein
MKVCGFCGRENRDTALACLSCKAIFPQTDNLSLQDALGFSTLSFKETQNETLPPGSSIDNMPPIEEAPMMKNLRLAIEQFLDEEIDEETLEDLMDICKQDMVALVRKINSLDEERFNILPNCYNMYREGLRKYENAQDILFEYLETGDETLYDEGMKKAEDAVWSIRRGWVLGTQELKYYVDQMSEKDRKIYYEKVGKKGR